MAHRFVAGMRYSGRVVEAGFIESKNGTRGFQLRLEDKDGAGEDFFTIWLTSSAAEGAKRSFASLGVSMGQLQNPSFYGSDGSGLINFVVGKEVEFWAKEEEYNGVRRVRIGGIGEGGGGKPIKPSGQDIAEFFTHCFPREVDPDDDIPFAVLLPAILPSLFALQFMLWS